MCTARLFSQGVDVFALKFYLDRVVPINYSSQQNTRDTGLSDGEDRILLRFDKIPECDGRTDRRTDGYAVAYTALAKLALRRAVKTSVPHTFNK